MRRALLISLMLVSAATGAAESPIPSPSESIDTSFLLLPAHDVERNAAGNPLVGDRISLRINGLNGGFRLDVPPGSSSLYDQGWDVSQPETTGEFGATPVKPGELVLPSLMIVGSDGKAMGRTNPLKFEVGSAIRPDDPKPQEPMENRPPVDMQFPMGVAIALAGAGFALALALIYMLYRVFRKGKSVPGSGKKSDSSKPEDVVALAALAELERQALWTQGKLKKHYFALSEILKRYLGLRFRFDALESTTTEILAWANSGQPFTDASIAPRLRSFLERADLVKFTDHVPSPSEPLHLIEEARAIVELTRRRIVATPTAAEGGLNGSP